MSLLQLWSQRACHLVLFVSSSHSQPQHQPAVTEAEDNLQSLDQQGTWHLFCYPFYWGLVVCECWASEMFELCVSCSFYQEKNNNISFDFFSVNVLPM